MRKFFFCVSLVLTGLMTSCIDKYEEVDADSKPSWLGGSIYAELKNPNASRLTGTFTNYLRLVDDLGYAETLNRTGSKTVFPANDEAFARFFASNQWGVSSYEELTESQKKLLLYSSMLDNALLLGMLPNASAGTSNGMPVIAEDEALKHPTNVKATDTVQFIANAAGMPRNNKYWEKYYNKGIELVSDATRPMIVHLTRGYMLSHGITTVGDGSDFEILTGSPYSEGNAYVFNIGIQKNPTTGKYNGDVTCQNGYIHQMEEVIVPPGNMAQVLRRKSNTSLFSRIVDYFAVPYYDATTTQNYNDWAKENGRQQIDSIFQLRYLSRRSQDGEALNVDPNKSSLSSTRLLKFDLGWNTYYPQVANPGQKDVAILDMGAFFVPTDEAVKQYFLPGGSGAYLIDIYGDRENTEANIGENLDSLFSKNPQVLTAFANNLMQADFSGTVPSKFSTILNDASENLGMKLDKIVRKDDGKYDITIANNGAIYVINELIAPDEYQAVLAPSSVYPDMSVMNWAVQDGVANGDYLGVDFKYYLLAMSANYGFFVPEDNAFDLYYLDPTSIYHQKNNQVGTQQPDLLHFYYDKTAKSQPYLKCDRYYYNMETGEAEGPVRQSSVTAAKSQLVDILNFHTLVLNEGERIGDNHYYKTKHGGELYIPDGNVEGGRVMGGAQIEDPDRFPAPRIKKIYNQKNGNTYRMDRVIMPPHKSVYAILTDNSQFSEFMDLCKGFDGASQLMTWAGISDEVNKTNNTSPQEAFTVFTRYYKMATETTRNNEACLDYNVRMFNTYNYTLFAPDNTAMEKAYSLGLPRWSEVEAIFNQYVDLEADHEVTAQEEQDMATVYAMLSAMRDFIRYHFMTISVYADNTVEGGRYKTMSSDATGVAKEVIISGGNGQLVVTEPTTQHRVTVNAADGTKAVNKMARDYWFGHMNDKNETEAEDKKNASNILTSSFCAVHQISDPLLGNNTSGRLDDGWASRAARARSLKRYKTLKANNEL